MTEADLKGDLCVYLRTALPKSFVKRHEDYCTSGIPDITVTWNGKTTWIEAKLANPDLKKKGIQTYSAMKLFEQGSCWFLIWEEKRGERRTLIVDPHDVHNKTIDQTPNERITEGFDHAFVEEFIRRIHT